MPKTKQQKIEAVTKLEEQLGRAKALVFADYKGLTMSQLSDLRNKLREQNAQLAITKNTILERALPSTNYQLPTTNFNGPTATLFAYDDAVSPIKILVKAFKDMGFGKVKFGFLGTDSLDEAKILQLSTLPSQQELRAKTVGILAAPLQGIVGVLQANLRNLVYALSEISRLPSVEQK